MNVPVQRAENCVAGTPSIGAFCQKKSIAVASTVPTAFPSSFGLAKNSPRNPGLPSGVKKHPRAVKSTDSSGANTFMRMRLSALRIPSATDTVSKGMTNPLPPPVGILVALGPITTTFRIFREKGSISPSFLSNTTASRATASAVSEETGFFSGIDQSRCSRSKNPKAMSVCTI